MLVDGDEVIPDSVRILRHLEARWPDRPLFPRDPARRAELDVFLDWFNGIWKLAPNAIEAELESEPPDERRIEDALATMRASLDVFEALLDGRDHLFGDVFGGRLRRLSVPEVRATARPRGRRALPPHPRGAPRPRRPVPAAIGLDRARGRAPARLGGSCLGRGRRLGSTLHQPTHHRYGVAVGELVLAGERAQVGKASAWPIAARVRRAARPRRPRPAIRMSSMARR